MKPTINIEIRRIVRESTVIFLKTRNGVERQITPAIEFCNCLQLHKFVDNTVSPIVWDNVILLCHEADFDYMYAYDNGEE